LFVEVKSIPGPLEQEYHTIVSLVSLYMLHPGPSTARW
jgi:hypothetical protein